MSLRLRIVLRVLLAILTPAALLGFSLFQDRRAGVAEAGVSLKALAGYPVRDARDASKYV
jgi:hypothetical protein